MRWPSRRCAEAIAARFDHVLVDEYQDTNRLQASILHGLKPDGRRADRGRRRRAVDLFLPRRRRCATSSISPLGFDPPAARGRRSPATIARRRRSSLRRTASSRSPPSASPRISGRSARRARAPASSPCATSRTRRAMSSSACSMRCERGLALQAAGGAVPRLASFRPARGRAHPAQHSLRQVRRAQVPGGGACQGPARHPALRREPARPHRRLPRHPAHAGHRPGHRRPRRSMRSPRCRRSARGAREPSLHRPRAGEDWRGFAEHARGAPRRQRSAGRRKSARRGRGTSRISSAATTMPPCACSISCSWSRSPAAILRASRFLTELTLDPPDATC